MLILLGMPVVQIILFGFAITTEVKNVRVAILDPSNDVVTRRIIDRLDASEYFSVTTNLNTPDEVEKSFRRGDIDLAVIFSEQFANHVYTGDACVQLVADATDPNTATTQPVMPPTSYPLPDAKCFRQECRFPLLFPK